MQYYFGPMNHKGNLGIPKLMYILIRLVILELHWEVGACYKRFSWKNSCLKTYLVTEKTTNTCIWTLSVNEPVMSSGTSHLGVELSGPSANTETRMTEAMRQNQLSTV